MPHDRRAAAAPWGGDGAPASRDGVTVLGIDPGLTRCGLGVVVGPVRAPRVRLVDVVTTGAATPVAERLARIHRAVTDAIARHRPDAVAVEQVLFSRNVRTAMATGQAAGVALLAAAQAGIPVTSHTPTRVKAVVAGHGGADKQAVGRMVAAQLGLDEPPRPADAADALAVALCHLVALGATTGGDGGGPADAAPGTADDWERALAGRAVRIVGGTA